MGRQRERHHRAGQTDVYDHDGNDGFHKVWGMHELSKHESSPNAGSMLSQRRRRWPNIDPASGR